MILKACITAVILAGSVNTALAHGNPHEMPPPCHLQTYLGKNYTVCRFDPSAADIRLFLKDDKGAVFGSFDAVNAQLAKTGEQLSFAMNAGMYHKDRAPVGLYIEAAQEQQTINTNAGPGNFHLLPNGVFWLSQFEQGDVTYKGASVASAKSYIERAQHVMAATQSGPMLVIDGKLHPKFKQNSTSLKIRNGVGEKDNQLVFVKSEMPVNFHEFASFYKDHIKSENALYLDGVVSRLYAAHLGRNDFGAKMGPIVGVVEKKTPPAPHSEARYIANEGVLISQGKTKIMFDPLPLSGFGTYPEVPETTKAQIMAGKGAYAGIDAVFISHAHRDHFSAENMITYMQAHSAVKLIAPQQALSAMQDHERWDAALAHRITAIDIEAGDAPQIIEFETIKTIKATAVRIPHAGWPAPERAAVQNLVFRVTLDGHATVMHMGDADPNPIHFKPHSAHWQAARTDTAFPPYWFFLSENGQAILSNDINADKAIGVHVPIEVPQDLKDSGADYFSIFEDTRNIGDVKE